MTVSETTTQGEPPRRKKRRIKIFWIVIGSPVALLLLLALGGVWYQANLQSQIEVELAEIRERGEPIEYADLAFGHVMPVGNPKSAVDQTEEWMEVIDRLAALEQVPSYEKYYPHALADSKLPVPGKPWSDELVVTNLMRELGPTWQEVEALAANPGEVRYPHDFEKGLYMYLPYAQNLQEVAKLLALRAYWQTYQGNNQQAVESLIAILRAADTLEHEPIMVCQIMRSGIESTMIETTLGLMPHANWSDAQLKRLQAELLKAGVSPKAMQRAIEGDFVNTYMAIHDPESLDQEMHVTYAWTRRADELFFLECRERMLHASTRSSKEVIAAGEALSIAMKPDSTLEKLNHIVTIMIFPDVTGFVFNCKESRVRANAAATLIACQRYHLSTGKWPAELSDLTPKFMETVPLDALIDEPLRYQRRDNEIVVYSVSRNLIDDGAPGFQERLGYQDDKEFHLKINQ